MRSLLGVSLISVLASCGYSGTDGMEDDPPGSPDDDMPDSCADGVEDIILIGEGRPDGYPGLYRFDPVSLALHEIGPVRCVGDLVGELTGLAISRDGIAHMLTVDGIAP